MLCLMSSCLFICSVCVFSQMMFVKCFCVCVCVCVCVCQKCIALRLHTKTCSSSKFSSSSLSTSTRLRFTLPSSKAGENSSSQSQHRTRIYTFTILFFPLLLPLISSATAPPAGWWWKLWIKEKNSSYNLVKTSLGLFNIQFLPVYPFTYILHTEPFKWSSRKFPCDGIIHETLNSWFFVCLCVFRFVGYPGNYNTLFGVRNEDVSLSIVWWRWRIKEDRTSFIFYATNLPRYWCVCGRLFDFYMRDRDRERFICASVFQCGAGGCLVELAQELLVIMVGKQLINNIQEFIVP